MTHSLWMGTLTELITLFPSRIFFCMEKALRMNCKEFPKAFPVKCKVGRALQFTTPSRVTSLLKHPQTHGNKMTF